MGEFALMLKKEQEAEQKRKAQGVTYPTEQKVVTPTQGAANTAPTITWKQDGVVNVKSNDQQIANQTKIKELESVTAHPNFKNISISGGEKWKRDKSKADNLLRDPGYKRFQEYIKKNNFAGTPEGISGMQQILGENNDRYMPQGNWTFQQNNIFRYHYQTNPENAKAYAAAINDEYKRANEERLAGWAVKNQALAIGGTWIADRIAPAETMDTELTYAQTGKLPYTTQVTPGRYSTLVREAIRDDLDETSGDRVMGDMYAAIDSAVNSAYYEYLEKVGGPLGMAIGTVNNFSRDYNDALYEAKSRGATDEELIHYARGIGASGAAGNLISDRFSKKLGGNENVLDSMLREGVSNTVGGTINRLANYVIDQEILEKNSEFNDLVDAYIATGKLQTEAEELASDILRRKLLRGILDDIGTGLAYGLGRSDNSVKRGLFK